MKKTINLEKLFKGLIILSFVFILIMWVIIIFYPEIEEVEHVNFSLIDIISSVLILLYIASLFLLYNFCKLGKILFTPLNLLMIFFTSPLSLIDFSVNHLVHIIDELSLIVTGAIITLIYCTDLKEKFVSSSKKKDESLS